MSGLHSVLIIFDPRGTYLTHTTTRVTHDPLQPIRALCTVWWFMSFSSRLFRLRNHVSAAGVIVTVMSTSLDWRERDKIPDAIRRHKTSMSSLLEAQWRHQGHNLIQVLPCFLLDDKSLCEPIQSYGKLNPHEHIPKKFYMKFTKWNQENVFATASCEMSGQYLPKFKCLLCRPIRRQFHRRTFIQGGR